MGQLDNIGCLTIHMILCRRTCGWLQLWLWGWGVQLPGEHGGGGAAARGLGRQDHAGGQAGGGGGRHHHPPPLRHWQPQPWVKTTDPCSCPPLSVITHLRFHLHHPSLPSCQFASVMKINPALKDTLWHTNCHVSQFWAFPSINFKMLQPSQVPTILHTVVHFSWSVPVCDVEQNE